MTIVYRLSVNLTDNVRPTGKLREINRSSFSSAGDRALSTFVPAWSRSPGFAEERASLGAVREAGFPAVLVVAMTGRFDSAGCWLRRGDFAAAPLEQVDWCSVFTSGTSRRVECHLTTHSRLPQNSYHSGFI
jgi:hypothetical protein